MDQFSSRSSTGSSTTTPSPKTPDPLASLASSLGISGQFLTAPKTPTTPTLDVTKSVGTPGTGSGTDLSGYAFDYSGSAVKKPTPVVSSQTAANGPVANAQTTLSEVQNRQSQMDAYTASMKAQGLNNDGTPIVPAVTTPATTPTDPNQEVNDAALHPGQTKYFNQTTGAPEWLSTTATPPAGYSTADPTKRTDVSDTVQGEGGITFKKFSDGTYGRFNLTTGDYSLANSADFEVAKRVSDANKRLDDLNNGIYTPAQQAQLDAIKTQYADLIKKQGVANDNATGSQTIFQNLMGLGNNAIGQGAIKGVIDEGISKVAALNAQMVSAISKMEDAFRTDDMNLLQSAYSQYTTSQQAVQKSIDGIQATIEKAKEKQDLKNQDFALGMIKKYGDTEVPIDQFDTPAEIQEKLKTSPKYQDEQAVATKLTGDEKDWWGQLMASGAASKIAFPTGQGGAMSDLKVGLIKSMISNAKKVGMSPNDLALSLTQKTAADKVYTDVLKRGELLKAGEVKTKLAFENVKALGAKMDEKNISSSIPQFEKWLRTGEVNFTGDKETVAYLGALTTSLTEYAKVISGSTGAGGVTVSMNDEAQKLLSAGLSPETVNYYIDHTAIPEMGYAMDGFNSSLSDLDKTIRASNGTNSAAILGSSDTSSTPSTSGGSGINDAW